ncbi:tape measure protein [Empedobacter sp. GD03739]|uniref:tape measure protein n=1 Tax=Empedobacter sp. GD03739 TaxID=2975376 RepID=UPI0024469CD8|nr:tape measure protein [Empedobacter sp. GD03739]MDH1602564.1 tape measure protein [Empedobacter sp. GD03739]
MSNLLQYTIQLRDQMSSVLNRLNGSTRTTNNTLNQLQRDTLNGSRAMREAGASANTLRQKLEQLRGQREFIRTSDVQTIQRYNREMQLLERQISRVENTGGRGLVGGLTDALQSMPFGNVLTNPLFQAGIVGAKALSLGIQQDLQNTSFEVLLGSKEASQKMVADITKYGMDTPYDKMGLGENAKTLLGFQVQAEKIMPTIKAIGDVAMGDANKMQSLTLAFGQMSSAGKLTGNDFLQMINAGFNPLSEISRKTGKSIGNLKEEMEKGAISSKMVENAFISATSAGGQYHNMAIKQGQTLGGKWAQFQDIVNDKLLILYQVLGPIATKGLEVANIFIEFASNGLGKMFTLIKEGNPWMWGLVTVLGAYVVGMGAAVAIQKIKTGWDFIASGALMTQVTTWWSLNAAMYANPVGLIIAGVIALIAVLGYLIYKVDGWGKAWEYTVQGATIIWDAFSTQAKSSFEILVNGFMIGINKIQQGWYQFKNAVGLGDSSENNAMLSSLDKEISDRKKTIERAQYDLNNASYKGAGEAFKKGINSLSWNSDRSLGDVITGMKDKLGMGGSAIGGGIAPPKTGLGTGQVETALGGNSGKKDAAKTNQATTTGGSKSNYITVNLDALIKGLTINSENSDDSSNQLQNKTTDALLRVLAMATTAGS